MSQSNTSKFNPSHSLLRKKKIWSARNTFTGTKVEGLTIKWKSFWRRASVPRVTFWTGFKQCESNPFAVILFSKCLLKNTLRPGQPPPSPPPFPTGKLFSRIGLRLLKELKFHQFFNFLKRRLLFFMLQCFSSVSKQSTCWCRLPFLRNWHGSVVCLSIDLAP